MMKKKISVLVSAIMLLSVSVAYSQNVSEELLLPRKVENVELQSLTGESVSLPMWGEKNLMIFYVDPDKPSQCNDFTVDMEENKRAAGDNIYGFGIMNLKDAPMIPNSLACKIANKRTAKNGATVLADKKRILRDAWALGECNNKFVLMIVSKEGELVYVHKGEFSPEEADEFYRIIEQYK
jgi:predicted transcriptional regulator